MFFPWYAKRSFVSFLILLDSRLITLFETFHIIPHSQNQKLVELFSLHPQKRKQCKNLEWICFLLNCFVNIFAATIAQQIYINMQMKKDMQVKNYVEWKMANVDRNIYSSFFSSNGMFFNLSWLEILRNSSVFFICRFLDSFELKIKLLIVSMSLMVSDETREVLIFLCRLPTAFFPTNTLERSRISL